MAMSTWVLTLLLLVLQGGDVSAKGSGGYKVTKSYPRPSSSNAYKYLAAGAAGAAVGVAGYYIGSRLYRYAAHNDYYREPYRSRYGRNSHWSSESCSRRTYDVTPRPEETRAWAIFTVRVNTRNYSATEYEVDLFRDLSWRLAPCNSPTDVVVMYECATSSVPTESQYDNPAVCYRRGDEESLHSEARRKLLQFGQERVVLTYVGVSDDDKIKITQEAGRETIDDTRSPVHQRYSSRTLKTEADRGEDDDDSGSVAAGIAFTILVALCCSCACGLVFLATKRSSSRSREEPYADRDYKDDGYPSATSPPQGGYYPEQQMQPMGGLSRKNDDIIGETLTGYHIESCDIENSTLTNCTISQADLKGTCELVNCNLTSADIYGQVTLRGGYFNNGEVKHGGHLINYGAQVTNVDNFYG